MSTHPRLPLPRSLPGAAEPVQVGACEAIWQHFCLMTVDLAQVCRPNVYRTLVGSGLELEWRKEMLPGGGRGCG